MRLTFPKNPKTVGWARPVAIALLVGFGTLLLSLPISFFLFLTHYNSAYPKDPQNLLSSLTASVLVGLGLAAIIGATSLLLSFLFGAHRPAASASV
ncbi:hypothetical protein [Granulicella arctica]|uniref:Na+/H+ antiporter NhaA n=1 Tax=Granulicella arctica TaxID=940613 RepID=A0A7Y9TKE2_9BACT|nr:hypothetical protein [Granulicella arctica]NYF79167.1 Na+/H+ antiporter NhaA [Granulicella arctica]